MRLEDINIGDCLEMNLRGWKAGVITKKEGKRLLLLFEEEKNEKGDCSGTPTMWIDESWLPDIAPAGTNISFTMEKRRELRSKVFGKEEPSLEDSKVPKEKSSAEETIPVTSLAAPQQQPQAQRTAPKRRAMNRAGEGNNTESNAFRSGSRLSQSRGSVTGGSKPSSTSPPPIGN